MFTAPKCWLLLATLAKLTTADTGNVSTTSPNNTTIPGLGPPADWYPETPSSTAANSLNGKSGSILNYILLSIFLSAVLYRAFMSSVRYARTLACLNTDRQLYFLEPNQAFAFIKKHIMDAPLFRRRHTEELRLSSVTNGTTLPTRLEFMLIAGALAANISLSLVHIHWSEGGEVALAELQNRTGVLALVNVFPLFVIGIRNNPLIPLLNIPFEIFNMIHRWLGRIVFLEVACHSTCYLISMIKYSGGWAQVKLSMRESPMILGGFLAATAATILLVHSPSPLRHAFYEIFLHLHIAFAVVFIACVFIHLKAFPHLTLPLRLAVAVWAGDRVVRLLIIFYRNVGKESTKAVIECLPGDAVRVTLSMARPWNFKPGQHLYLCIPSIGLWTSHPFAICWGEEEDLFDPEKGIALSRQDILAMKKTVMSLVVRRRAGFTDRLFQRVQDASQGKIVLSAFVEGPYGGYHSLSSYGTVMLFASGIGITHQLPYVRHLIAGHGNNTVACRRVVLVWIIPNPEHLEWIRPWMASILSLPSRREVLRIMLFITSPRSTKEIHSPSTSLQMFPGRPNVETLIELETVNQIGSMAVSVCGTGTLADAVRKAVRKRQAEKNVELIEVAFSW